MLTFSHGICCLVVVFLLAIPKYVLLRLGHQQLLVIGCSVSTDFYLLVYCFPLLKFMFSMKATKIEEIFTVDLTVYSKCQIDGEDFIKFFGLLRKHKL